jgi:hypothetical protein
MNEDDYGNPLKVYHLYITNEVKYVADSIVDQYDTPHEKTMKYMGYMNTTFTFGPHDFDGMAYPHKILQNKKGQCGDYAIMLSAFLATQGIPTRIVGMYNYHNSAHVVVGVYYDELWHMYDPTYMAYWVDENNTILSFYDLRDDTTHITLVGGNTTIPPIYLNEEIYRISTPAGVIGPPNPMIWDLSIDMNTNNTFVVPPPTEYRAGSGYIGATYINNFQRWTFRNLTENRTYSFVVYPIEVWGSDIFILRTDRGDVAEIRNDNILPVRINITARNSTETLELHHDYRGYADVLVLIEKYELVEMGL